MWLKATCFLLSDVVSQQKRLLHRRAAHKKLSQEIDMAALTNISTGAVRRSILGRGCDPQRAAFAKKAWEPVLNVDVDTATSDQQLLQLLTSGKKYSVFFIAPGQCQLIKMGRVDGEGMKRLVKEHQPECQIVEIADVGDGLTLLSKALGQAAVGDVKPLTEAWPFVD